MTLSPMIFQWCHCKGSSATGGSSAIEDKVSADITGPLISESCDSSDRGSSGDIQTLSYSRFDIDMELCK